MKRMVLILTAALVLLLPLCAAFGEEAAWTYALLPSEVKEELLLLASAQEPLDASYVPDDLVTLKSQRVDNSGNSIGGGLNLGTSANLQVCAEVEDALERLTQEAAKEGITIYLRGGYRSYQEESRRYQQLSRRGKATAKPGETDYQTGLAVTLTDAEWLSVDLTEAFVESEAYAWLADNSGRFGFVLRYPEGKEELTGNAWEPWHLRYVGIKPAAYMRRNGYCLEEFVAEYRQVQADFLAAGGRLE